MRVACSKTPCTLHSMCPLVKCAAHTKRRLHGSAGQTARSGQKQKMQTISSSTHKAVLEKIKSKSFGRKSKEINRCACGGKLAASIMNPQPPDKDLCSCLCVGLVCWTCVWTYKIISYNSAVRRIVSLASTLRPDAVRELDTFRLTLNQIESI